MSIRTARVAEEIQKVLGERLVRGLRDPLPGFVTIRAVEVTSDFGHAKVFVSVFGSPAQKAAAIEGLKAQRGSLRKEVGTKIRLRQTPELQFILDESAERAARVHALLDEAKAHETALKARVEAEAAAVAAPVVAPVPAVAAPVAPEAPTFASLSRPAVKKAPAKKSPAKTSPAKKSPAKTSPAKSAQAPKKKAAKKAAKK